MYMHGDEQDDIFCLLAMITELAYIDSRSLVPVKKTTLCIVLLKAKLKEFGKLFEKCVYITSGKSSGVRESTGK